MARTRTVPFDIQDAYKLCISIRDLEVRAEVLDWGTTRLLRALLCLKVVYPERRKDVCSFRISNFFVLVQLLLLFTPSYQ